MIASRPTFPPSVGVPIAASPRRQRRHRRPTTTTKPASSPGSHAPDPPPPPSRDDGTSSIPVGFFSAGGASSSSSMWNAPAGSPEDIVGGLSEQAVAERRKRNREHAKRSRVRKKVLLDSLQEELRELQRENAKLKSIVSERLPRSVAHGVMAECCRKSGGGPTQQLPPPPEGSASTAGGTTIASSSSSAAFPAAAAAAADPGGTVSDDGDASRRTTGAAAAELARPDFALISSLLSAGRRSFVLSDPRLPDNPIVYASDGFCELTGYHRDQILGRNCRFLQGPDTDPIAVAEIREAVESGSDCSTRLLNYKSDGTPFWNQFFVAALRDSRDEVVNYVGVQCEVDSKTDGSEEEEGEED